MALNFDLTRIENWQERCFDEGGFLRAETEELVWLLVDVGVNEITAKNVEEIAFRCGLVRALWWGEAISDASERIAPLLLDHIGLHTNVGPMTRAAWIKKQMDMINRTAQAGVREEIRRREALRATQEER